MTLEIDRNGDTLILSGAAFIAPDKAGAATAHAILARLTMRGVVAAGAIGGAPGLFVPFAADGALTIDGLMFENTDEGLSIAGKAEIPIAGPAISAIVAALRDAIAAIAAGVTLEKPPAQTPGTVPNPFR
jgi:hypothetical protein